MAVATNETEQAAAAGDRAAAARTSNAAENARPAPATRLLDPELFMAARGGDSKRLRELLKLTDDGGDEQAGAAEHTAAAAAATAAQVVVEVERRPPPSAAATTSSGAAAALQLLDGVTPEGDSLLHVVAAAGDGEEFLDCARVIYRGKKGLLVARNNKGDTPLHCAAGAGYAAMISCLVALKTAEAAGDQAAIKQFLRMRNDECGETMRNQEGRTALHQAVRAANEACIDKLMAVDLELARIPNEEDEGDTTSPLYLAISLGDMDIARCLLDKSNGKLSYSGPDGRNILHAAVSRGKVLAAVVEWLKDVMVDEKVGGHHVSVPLLSQFAIQRDKQTGTTPLHLAASSSLWWPSLMPRVLLRILPRLMPWDMLLRILPRLMPWDMRISRTALLLEANACCVYQPDHEGLFPIHVAAMTGNLDAVMTLLQRRPDCATLRDAKGRTFLHAAVEKEKYLVVKIACQRPEFSSVLNAQDNQGDTALHRAIDAGSLKLCHCLLRNPSVRLDISNKKAQKPLDLSRSKIPKGPIYVLNARRMILESLVDLRAPCGGENRADLFRDKHIPDRDEDRESDSRLKDQTQVVGIVSALVATVTFASAFTIPGGYRSTADGGWAAGTPVLAGSYAFNAFILADTLAFICSCLATFSLIYVGAHMDTSPRIKYLNISSRLMQSSVRSLVVAFALGLYLTLAPRVAHGYTTSIVVLVILSTSLIYGHPVPRKLICAADMVRARLGIRHPAVRYYVSQSFIWVMSHDFWPFIIIFGLPAIIKWIKVHHTS